MTSKELNKDAQTLFRMTQGQFNALDRVANRYGVKRTRLIREMLTQCLHAMGEPVMDPETRWETFKKHLARDMASQLKKEPRQCRGFVFKQTLRRGVRRFLYRGHRP